jgi:hypothetical protein
MAYSRSMCRDLGIPYVRIFNGCRMTDVWTDGHWLTTKVEVLST